MTTQSITLHLSDPVYRYLQQVAAITKRPLEQVELSTQGEFVYPGEARALSASPL